MKKKGKCIEAWDSKMTLGKGSSSQSCQLNSTLRTHLVKDSPLSVIVLRPTHASHGIHMLTHINTYESINK